MSLGLTPAYDNLFEEKDTQCISHQSIFNTLWYTAQKWIDYNSRAVLSNLGILLENKYLYLDNKAICTNGSLVAIMNSKIELAKELLAKTFLTSLCI